MEIVKADADNRSRKSLESTLVDLLDDIGTTRKATADQPQKGHTHTDEADSQKNLNDLADKYGITQEGEKFIFQTFKYDQLEDAVKYARMVTR